MSWSISFLVGLLALGGCATALNEGGPGSDGGGGHDSATPSDSASSDASDATASDAKDSALIFETEGDAAPIDSSVSDTTSTDVGDVGDVGTDAAKDSGVDTAPLDTGFDAGFDSGPTCVTSAPKVLFYTLGNKEQPYLPAGATVTMATDASWRAMTTADFAKYQLVVIGEGAGLAGPASIWQTAFDTKAIWTPAITGRVTITTLDPATHAGYGVAAASVFLKAALQWTASGPGTGLYVGPDLGWRKLDFLSGFGAFTAVGQISPDSVSGDDVTVVLGSSPLMAGSTSASLSSWSVSYHGAVTGFPAPFKMIASVTSVPSRGVVVARDVPCPP